MRYRKSGPDRSFTIFKNGERPVWPRFPARQVLDNDKFITVVLGNSKNFDKALDTLGKVTTIDVSIPPDN